MRRVEYMAAKSPVRVTSIQTIKVIGLFFIELALKNWAMHVHFNPRGLYPPSLYRVKKSPAQWGRLILVVLGTNLHLDN